MTKEKIAQAQVMLNDIDKLEKIKSVLSEAKGSSLCAGKQTGNSVQVIRTCVVSTSMLDQFIQIVQKAINDKQREFDEL